ncbi:MAG: SpoVG family protein [Oscillospiraceae bacterium]|nr:SpoVG family protein [Oscillospiraceae bacterium]
MQITDIKIRKIFTEGKLRAILSITVDNLIAIHDIKVVQGEDRFFVAMPSRRDENGIFRDVVHPISAEGRIFIENEVLKAYNEYLMVNEIENSTQDFSSLPS